MDGQHLFEGVQTPPHALTVFVPLGDVPEEMGVPEFFPHSQQIPVLQQMGQGQFEYAPVSFSPLHRGAAIIFDYRCVHRGTANRSTEPRPMLYMVYTKSWFADRANFGEASLFEQ